MYFPQIQITTNRRELPFRLILLQKSILRMKKNVLILFLVKNILETTNSATNMKIAHCVS
jgi:hypothetical protein